jgi:hypothetical protein
MSMSRVVVGISGEAHLERKMVLHTADLDRANAMAFASPTSPKKPERPGISVAFASPTKPPLLQQPPFDPMSPRKPQSLVSAVPGLFERFATAFREGVVDLRTNGADDMNCTVRYLRERLLRQSRGANNANTTKI